MRERIIVDGIEVEAEEARRIVDDVMHDPDGTGRTRRVPWRHPGLPVIIGALAMSVVPPLIPGIGRGWLAFATMIVVFVVVTAIGMRVYWHLNRRRVRAAMTRHGYALCTTCGYWLRGLAPNERCPECGTPREGAQSEHAAPS